VAHKVHLYTVIDLARELSKKPRKIRIIRIPRGTGNRSFPRRVCRASETALIRILLNEVLHQEREVRRQAERAATICRQEHLSLFAVPGQRAIGSEPDGEFTARVRTLADAAKLAERVQSFVVPECLGAERHGMVVRHGGMVYDFFNEDPHGLDSYTDARQSSFSI
jgi:hypothetical protein